MRKGRINIFGTLGEVQIREDDLPRGLVGKLCGVLAVYITGVTKGQIRRKVNFIKKAVKEARSKV